MRIIYLGDDFIHSTSAHRAAALRRLGHDVIVVNPRALIPRGRLVSGLNVRTGFRLFAPWVSLRLRTKIQLLVEAAGWACAQVIWVDGCPELPPSFYLWLKRLGCQIVTYLIDDPFGGRDRRKWDQCLKSLPYVDQAVVVREPNVVEARQAGARKVIRVYMSCDPVAHAPLQLTPDDHKKWASEVAFIGTWMPERGPFIRRLLELNVPLSLWGDRWQKASEWHLLKSVWRGPAIYGADYIKAVQCSKVMVGLLSKGNRDLCTTRSVEIPFIGGAVFCAQRTSEHQSMLTEGSEALFWSTVDECAVQCRDLLSSPDRRSAMAAAAQTRIRRQNVTNDVVLGLCIEALSK